MRKPASGADLSKPFWSDFSVVEQSFCFGLLSEK
jgi:hypothetical protein